MASTSFSPGDSLNESGMSEGRRRYMDIHHVRYLSGVTELCSALWLIVTHSSQSSLNGEYSSRAETPNPEFRSAPSHVRSRSETVQLFQDAVDQARDSMQEPVISEKIKSGISLNLTIDLKRQNIETLPDSIVDILKNDVERIVLSYNQIESLPLRFSECAHITYLTLRSNSFKHFPMAVCNLLELQVLDMSRNQLIALPEELQKMKRLRFLSVNNNRLENLPYSLGFLEGLRLLKVEGNPLNETLRTIVNSTETTPSPLDTPIGQDKQAGYITEKIKQYLKLEATTLETSTESSGESPLETPKPIKRQSTLRFPVVPTNGNGESLSDQRSPGFVKPPIPQRSHFRITSGQSSLLQKPGARRPGVTPLIISSDRNRSNSESVIQATENARNKRMGIMSARKLDSLDEVSSNRNSLHLRGTSHASALRDRNHRPYKSNIGSGSSNSISPTEEHTPGFLSHRLRSVPVRRSGNAPPDQLIESARSFVFALHFVHPTIESLASTMSGGPTRHPSLERLCSEAYSHIVLLDQAICLYSDDHSQSLKRKKKMLVNIRHAVNACRTAHEQVLEGLAHSVQDLVMIADERYIRTFKLILHGSIAEIAHATAALAFRPGPYPAVNVERPSLPMMAQPPRLMIQGANAPLRERQTTPTRDRTQQVSAPSKRYRSDTMNSLRSQPQSRTTVSNLQSAKPYQNERSRSNSRSNALLTSAISSVANTPKSEESFLMPATPSLPGLDAVTLNGFGDFNQEAAFERVYSSVLNAVQRGQRILPHVISQLDQGIEAARDLGKKKLADTWQRCAFQARQSLESCSALGTRLSTVKLNDPEPRHSREFWAFTMRYITSCMRLLADLKIVKQSNPLEMSRLNLGNALKPLHEANKRAAAAATSSPWAHYITKEGQEKPPPTALSVTTDWRSPLNGHLNGQASRHQRGGRGDSGGSSSSPYMPTTPLSAALGPAAFATIPTSASSTASSFDRTFKGNVFERADTLLSSQQTSFSRR